MNRTKSVMLYFFTSDNTVSRIHIFRSQITSAAHETGRQHGIRTWGQPTATVISVLPHRCCGTHRPSQEPGVLWTSQEGGHLPCLQNVQLAMVVPGEISSMAVFRSQKSHSCHHSAPMWPDAWSVGPDSRESISVLWGLCTLLSPMSETAQLPAPPDLEPLPPYSPLCSRGAQQTVCPHPRGYLKPVTDVRGGFQGMGEGVTGGQWSREPSRKHTARGG